MPRQSVADLLGEADQAPAVLPPRPAPLRQHRRPRWRSRSRTGQHRRAQRAGPGMPVLPE